MKRAFVALLVGVALVGCHRNVQVKTAPTPSTSTAAVTFKVTNNLAQPVNVYVTTGGTDVLAGTVAGNSTSALSVRGVGTGATAARRARAAARTRTCTRDDVS